MFYTRQQLRLLVVLATTLLLGLAIREWRSGFPAQAERLETFDREEAPPLPPVPLRAPAAEKRNLRAAPGSPSTAEREAAPTTARPRGRKARDAAEVSDPRPLDLNRASLEELARLPGIGPGLARRILRERERRGRFDSPDNLRGVLGVGAKKLAALRDLVTVGE